MPKILKKYLIPHEINNFHPYLLKHSSLLGFSVLFFISNFFLFPLLGVDNQVKAAGVNSDELISYANQSRQASGLKTLQKNSLLTKAATEKAKDMFAKQYWSHYGPNGETPWQFMSQAGYIYVTAGENLAKNFDNSLDIH